MIVKKFKKKVMSLLIAICMMLGIVLPVSAANTSDTPYRIKKVLERDKQNNTKVYVHIEASPTKYTQTRVYGDRNTGSVFYNETKNGLAKILRNEESSVTNYIYENKKSNYTYVLATIGFRSNSSKTGYVEGVWSPDSTRNYTVVN